MLQRFPNGKGLKQLFWKTKGINHKDKTFEFMKEKTRNNEVKSLPSFVTQLILNSFFF